MKILGGGGGITNAEVARGAQLQKSLESRAGMLRSLPFISVRQQHCQARALFPLVVAGGDILIDDRLGDVIKIAKLRFPHDQRVSGDD